MTDWITLAFANLTWPLPYTLQPLFIFNYDQIINYLYFRFFINTFYLDKMSLFLLINLSEYSVWLPYVQHFINMLWQGLNIIAMISTL